MLNINNLIVSHDLDAEAMRAVCGGGADRANLVYGLLIADQYDVSNEAHGETDNGLRFGAGHHEFLSEPNSGTR